MKCYPLLAGFELMSVSLFTREWIEIIDFQFFDKLVHESPSLRGSGLKLAVGECCRIALQSPSLRGSGLKLLHGIQLCLYLLSLPLYEGAD